MLAISVRIKRYDREKVVDSLYIRVAIPVHSASEVDIATDVCKFCFRAISDPLLGKRYQVVLP